MTDDILPPKSFSDVFACYEAQFQAITDLAQTRPFHLWQSEYQLSSAIVFQWRLELIPKASMPSDIEDTCRLAIKAVQSRFQRYVNDHQIDKRHHFILIVAVDKVTEFAKAAETASDDFPNIELEFGSRYFLESLIVEVENEPPLLQVFSASNWQKIEETLISPSDILQFLTYRYQHLLSDIDRAQASFECEEELLKRFLLSDDLLAPAIAIDNLLIKSGLKDAPNSDLVAMSIAQRRHDERWQDCWSQLWQSAKFWSQLSDQMVISLPSSQKPTSQSQPQNWKGILLSESMLSRYELIRAIWQHHSRPPNMKASGYVIHQHSYSSFGRHFVLIFYGSKAQSLQSRRTLQPQFEQIALDVAGRLPLDALHQIVIIGIEFIEQYDEILVDLDVFIQPITPMTEKERSLTRQLQKLQQKNPSLTPAKFASSFDINQAKVSLQMSISSHNTPKK